MTVERSKKIVRRKYAHETNMIGSAERALRGGVRKKGKIEKN